MSVTSAINLQMNDFNREIENMDGNFSVFSKVTADILNDLKDATQSMNQAVLNTKENTDDIETFMSNITDSVLKECDSIFNAASKLNQSIAEAKHFRVLEQEFRRNFENNPTELREKDFKDILIAKPERAGVHPELEKIKQLVENAKNGIINGIEEDDLVMDTEMTQGPKKCPITTKTIEVPCKNTTCDHVYEREAILQMIKQKGKNKLKCPVAGCTQFVVIR